MRIKYQRAVNMSGADDITNSFCLDLVLKF